MATILSILTILASIVLILVVLVQNSKGGGLSANFSSSNQIMGAPKTADFLEKTTWALAGVVIVLSLASSKVEGTNNNQSDILPITVPVDNTQAPDMQSPAPTTATPQLPAPAPAN